MLFNDGGVFSSNGKYLRLKIYRTLITQRLYHSFMIKRRSLPKNILAQVKSKNVCLLIRRKINVQVFLCLWIENNRRGLINRKILGLQQLIRDFNTMTNDISSILAQIRALLRDYTSKKHQNTLLNQQRIDQLLEKIEAWTQQPTNILNAILINPTILSKMKVLLVERLLRESTEAKFLQKYAKEASKSREEYQIQKCSLSNLIREIFDSSKPIEEELQNVKLNLETCQNQQVDRLFATAINSEAMSMGCLLRMVMEATELDLDNCFDQMLFRIFLLEQSLILIFHKTEYVLQQLSLTIQEEREEEPKSPSVNTKRSALSQSIQIYKSNLKKKEEEVSKALHQKKSHQTVIKTDYQLVCKTEKKLPQAQRKINCCF